MSRRANPHAQPLRKRIPRPGTDLNNLGVGSRHDLANGLVLRVPTLSVRDLSVSRLLPRGVFTAVVGRLV
ncbi:MULTISPECIES: hypothetical protein [Natrialbaceae]|uniref:hypothetical protein n=1 Tax=Natrialbaceae TaxID=1644061 RepID=UPI00207CF025|nr:hypothetical protein [Natronococcus sp. CG52]